LVLCFSFMMIRDSRTTQMGMVALTAKRGKPLRGCGGCSPQRAVQGLAWQPQTSSPPTALLNPFLLLESGAGPSPAKALMASLSRRASR
jgi:hypothetical protein